MSGKTPSDLITDSAIQEVVLADFGPKSKLKSWLIEDFTSKGDNYASFVTSIKVKVENPISKNLDELTYIAKLSPCRDSEAWKTVTNKLFINEGTFLTQVIPDFNNVLQSLEFKKLNVPTCYYTCFKEEEEFNVLNDLRRDGFEMGNRKQGLDFEHISLVIKEIARLHASSYVLKERRNQCLGEIYPFMLHNFFEDRTDPFNLMFDGFLKARYGSYMKILEKIEGYSKAKEFITKYQNNLDLWAQLTSANSNSVFQAVCHGDLWINNMLFRYGINEYLCIMQKIYKVTFPPIKSTNSFLIHFEYI